FQSLLFAQVLYAIYQFARETFIFKFGGDRHVERYGEFAQIGYLPAGYILCDDFNIGRLYTVLRTRYGDFPFAFQCRDLVGAEGLDGAGHRFHVFAYLWAERFKIRLDFLLDDARRI